MRNAGLILILAGLICLVAGRVAAKYEDRIQSLEQQLVETQHDLRACRMGH